MIEFCFYSERPVQNTIKEVFIDFKIHTISNEDINKNNFTNKNILMIVNENLPADINDDFFLKNNVVIFFLKKGKQQKKYYNTKVFSGHTNINRFKDEAITFFMSNSFIYKDIIIRGEKIMNSKDKREAFLTSPEKDILILLFERKKIEKKTLLESVLRLKKDTETKTIESHLTRIRKKLLTIGSQIEIISREKSVFLVV